MGSRPQGRLPRSCIRGGPGPVRPLAATPIDVVVTRVLPGTREPCSRQQRRDEVPPTGGQEPFGAQPTPQTSVHRPTVAIVRTPPTQPIGSSAGLGKQASPLQRFSR